MRSISYAFPWLWLMAGWLCLDTVNASAAVQNGTQPAVAADTKPVKAKSPKAVVKKPVVKKMNPTLASTQKNPSKLKFSNPPRKGTGSIPNWE